MILSGNHKRRYLRTWLTCERVRICAWTVFFFASVLTLRRLQFSNLLDGLPVVRNWLIPTIYFAYGWFCLRWIGHRNLALGLSLRKGIRIAGPFSVASGRGWKIFYIGLGTLVLLAGQVLQWTWPGPPPAISVFVGEPFALFMIAGLISGWIEYRRHLKAGFTAGEDED